VNKRIQFSYRKNEEVNKKDDNSDRKNEFANTLFRFSKPLLVLAECRVAAPAVVGCFSPTTEAEPVGIKRGNKIK
jgi:hypothetical protein